MFILIKKYPFLAGIVSDSVTFILSICRLKLSVPCNREVSVEVSDNATLPSSQIIVNGRLNIHPN